MRCRLEWFSMDGFFRGVEFSVQIMDAVDLGVVAEGFTGVIRFVWAVYLMLTRGVSEVSSNGASLGDDTNARLCLNRVCENDVFEFLTIRILKTATFQVSLSLIPSLCNRNIRLLCGIYCNCRIRFY